jgi:hypothetical protein
VLFSKKYWSCWIASFKSTISCDIGGNFILIIGTYVTTGLRFCWYGLVVYDATTGDVATIVGLNENADSNLLIIIPSYLP